MKKLCIILLILAVFLLTAGFLTAETRFLTDRAGKKDEVFTEAYLSSLYAMQLSITDTGIISKGASYVRQTV